MHILLFVKLVLNFQAKLTSKLLSSKINNGYATLLPALCLNDYSDYANGYDVPVSLDKTIQKGMLLE